MYFSTLPSEYERELKEEIWGMFKYMGIPIETIYAMPIHDRKFYIMKHNEEQEGIYRESTQAANSNVNTYNGNLNAFAKLEQDHNKIRGGKM